MNINRNKPLREVVRSVGCVMTRLTIYDDIPFIYIPLIYMYDGVWTISGGVLWFLYLCLVI